MYLYIFPICMYVRMYVCVYIVWLSYRIGTDLLAGAPEWLCMYRLELSGLAGSPYSRKYSMITTMCTGLIIRILLNITACCSVLPSKTFSYTYIFIMYFVCVCMYLFKLVCGITYVCMHLCMYVCMKVCLYVCMYIFANV